MASATNSQSVGSTATMATNAARDIRDRENDEASDQVVDEILF